MKEPVELSYEQCLDLLSGGVMGRVAVCLPSGPHIVPVNYAVVEESVVLRTSPYTALGTYGANAMLAFEVDHVDYERRTGWSVVAQGRGAVIENGDELATIRSTWDPTPWAGGSRPLYLRLPWTELSGRRIGPDRIRPEERPVHRRL